MSIPTPPRLRRDALATRAAIERAATDLVLAQGYEALTVERICDRAGVSQRTFFNHFRTKDSAVLGSALPAIDQRAARAFIVSDQPLLAGLVPVIIPAPSGVTSDVDPVLLARRIRAVGSAPILMARQMERLSGIEDELSEIIRLRLRTQWPGESEDARNQQAELITHLLAGLMRHIGLAWARHAADGTPPAVDSRFVEAQIKQVLAKLG